MIQKTSNGFKFSTGRSFYAHGYIGIMEEADQSISIAQGYDGYIDLEDKEGEPIETEDNESMLTQDEREELSDYMISLWTKFKNQ